MPFLCENMPLSSSYARLFTVLTEDNGVTCSKFEKEPGEYVLEQLKRWLKCRGLKQSKKQEEDRGSLETRERRENLIVAGRG